MDKTKQTISAVSVGAAALFIIFTILLPQIQDNAGAIVELQISEGIIITTIENNGDKLDDLDRKMTNANEKLNKILIIMCQNSDSVLCN